MKIDASGLLASFYPEDFTLTVFSIDSRFKHIRKRSKFSTISVLRMRGIVRSSRLARRTLGEAGTREQNSTLQKHQHEITP